MCELFYMRSKYGEGIPTSRLRHLFMTAVHASASNPDGFGVFTEDGMQFKTGDSLSSLTYSDVESIIDEIHGCREVVLHLRMATTGSTCQRNAHPFEYEGHCMSHNGVMRRLDASSVRDSTDSEDFLRQTVHSEGSTTVDKLEESLENTTGTLSIFWRDTNTGTTYYFRNRASFTFAESDEEVVGATRKNRLDVLDSHADSSRFKLRNHQTPDSGMIFRMPQYDRILEPVRQFSIGEQLESYRSSGVYSVYGSMGRHPSEYRDSDSEENDDIQERMVSTREYRMMSRPEYEQKESREHEYEEVEYSEIPEEW